MLHQNASPRPVEAVTVPLNDCHPILRSKLAHRWSAIAAMVPMKGP